jgi:asparagine synthase (glutamine-hydrolysing)
MAQWLKGDLKSLVDNLLSKEKVRAGNILNHEPIKRLIDEHLSRRQLNDRIIFALIMFQKWDEIRK